MAENVQGITVTRGEETTFNCSAVGSEVDIGWTIDGIKYESCPQEAGTDICFEDSYVSDTPDKWAQICKIEPHTNI